MKHQFLIKRNWLESNPDNQFHLIVDELHSYRGTQGTEVALVVRNFSIDWEFPHPHNN